MEFNINTLEEMCDLMCLNLIPKKEDGREQTQCVGFSTDAKSTAQSKNPNDEISYS